MFPPKFSAIRYTPLHCHYGMLVCSAKIIVVVTLHLVFCFLPTYQPFESRHLVGSHQLQGVMTVSSMILCHNVHTSSVVTSTDMIPCSIVRLCSGVLLLSKQHCLLFVVCILSFSCISSCHSSECVCCGTSRR